LGLDMLMMLWLLPINCAERGIQSRRSDPVK